MVTHVSEPFRFTTAGAIVFAPGVQLGGFYAEYETTFTPKKNEEIVFSFQTQGKAHLHINGKEVAEALNTKNSRAYAMKAEAGKTYDIKVDFRASEGDCATLNFDFGREVPLDIKQSVDNVKDADVIIFAGGITPGLEGEEMPIKVPGFRGGDRETIEPSGRTDAPAQRTKEYGKEDSVRQLLRFCRGTDSRGRHVRRYGAGLVSRTGRRRGRGLGALRRIQPRRTLADNVLQEHLSACPDSRITR